MDPPPLPQRPSIPPRLPEKPKPPLPPKRLYKSNSSLLSCTSSESIDCSTISLDEDCSSAKSTAKHHIQNIDSFEATRNKPNFCKDQPFLISKVMNALVIGSYLILQTSPLLLDVYKSTLEKLGQFHSSKRISQIHKKSDDELFMICGCEVWKLSVPSCKAQFLYVQTHFVDLFSVFNQSVASIDSNGNIVYFADGNYHKVKNFRVSAAMEKVEHILLLNDVLWMSSKKTLYTMDLSFGTESTITLAGIVSGSITKLLKLKESSVLCTMDDGKMIQFNSVNKSIVQIINCGFYKITSATVIKDHLWIAYALGKIQVISIQDDMNWKITKEWKGHTASIREINLHNNLAITLAENGGLALWDSTLYEDVLAASLRQNIAKFAKMQKIFVRLCSWNINARNLNEAHPPQIHKWIFSEQELMADLFVFHLQEVVNLESKRVNASTYYFLIL